MKEKATLKIIGMDCASCAAVIEHDLKKEKGVNSANVNFATGKAYLEFDPNQTSVDKVKKTVEDLGYKARSEDEEEMEMAGEHDHHKQEKEGEIKKLKFRFILSLVFSLPVIYMVMGGMAGLPCPKFLKITEF